MLATCTGANSGASWIDDRGRRSRGPSPAGRRRGSSSMRSPAPRRRCRWASAASSAGAAAMSNSGGSDNQRSSASHSSPFARRSSRACLRRYRAAMYLATLMLLGSGELGREFAIAAKRLGCRVVACDRYAERAGDADRRRLRGLPDARRQGAPRRGREAQARRHRPRDRGDRHRALAELEQRAGASRPRPRRCS